jgi:hypothetical protein
MPADESTPPERRALSPEEVGARVSAILEAAERDARAVIDAAHRAAAPSTEERSLEGIAAALDALGARVGALEAALAASAPAPAESSPLPPPERAKPQEPEEQKQEAPEEQKQEVPSAEPRTSAAPAAAVRVRAIELALAGYPRAAIARELGAAMAPGEVDALLDEVLAH